MLHAKCKTNLLYRKQLLLKPRNTNGLSAIVAILPCRNSSEKFSCCGVKDLWSLILYVQRENCSNNSLCAYYAHIQTKSNTKVVLDLSAQIMVVSQKSESVRHTPVLHQSATVSLSSNSPVTLFLELIIVTRFEYRMR